MKKEAKFFGMVFVLLVALIFSDCQRGRGGGGGGKEEGAGNPTIGLSTLYLSFSAKTGTQANPQSFDVWNSGGGTLNYTITDDVDWMYLVPAFGTSDGERDTITVTVTCPSVEGSYSGTIEVISANATNSPQRITVSLVCSGAEAQAMIGRSPVVMNFVAEKGTPAPSQTLSIWNAGGGTLNYTISDNATWLTESPTSGSSTGETDLITVSASCAGLALGTYNGTITISAVGATNSPQTVSVTLSCTASPTAPVIGLSPATMAFTAGVGSVANSQILSVWNKGAGILNYIITDNAEWLFETPTSGSSSGEIDSITVSASCGGLAPGDYSALITISDPSASNNPQIVSVTLECSNSPIIGYSPFNMYFITPVDTVAPTQTLSIWNTGGGTLFYDIIDNAEWLSESPTTGSSTTEIDSITVTASCAGRAAGTYNATISIVDKDASNNPVTVYVTLVCGQQLIGFNPPSIALSARIGLGADPAELHIYNAGEGFLSYELYDGVDWLWEIPPVGATTIAGETVLVYGSCEGLSEGSYSTNIVITAPDAANSPQSVPVTLTCTKGPIIGYSPLNLFFTAAVGEVAPAQTLSIWNAGGGTLNYELTDHTAFITENPTAGTSAGETDLITVTASCVGLAPGIYNDTITITDKDSGNSRTVSVTLTCTGNQPVIGLTPTSFTLSAPVGSALPPQTLYVYNAGTGTLNFAVSDDSSWLIVDPTSGVSSGPGNSVPISVLTSCVGLADGTYTGKITITDPHALPSSNTIDVTLTCTCPIAAPTLGIPANGTTSSVPLLFSWNPVAGATRYEISIAHCNNLLSCKNWNNDMVVATSITPASADWMKLRISDYGTLYWGVRANNGSCWGEWSEIRTLERLTTDWITQNGNQIIGFAGDVVINGNSVEINMSAPQAMSQANYSFTLINPDLTDSGNRDGGVVLSVCGVLSGDIEIGFLGTDLVCYRFDATPQAGGCSADYIFDTSVGPILWAGTTVAPCIVAPTSSDSAIINTIRVRYATY